MGRGLTTPIPESLCFEGDISKLPKVLGNTRIDLEYCHAMQLFTKVNNTHKLLIHGNASNSPPNPAKTTIMDKNNWLFNLEDS